jgi:hypothetical protein
MTRRRVALLLAVVGLVLLPAPLYLAAAADLTAPPPQTSQVYAGDPVDPTSESDQYTIISRHSYPLTLSVHQVSEQYSAGEYRAPNATNRVLRTAMADGSATADDPDVQTDLRAIAGGHRFVYDAYGDEEQYYRLRVRENGSAVSATPVSHGRVANATVEQAWVYENLTAAERETVDAILDNSSEEEWGYRPPVDDAFVDRLPALVWKDGTLYSLHVVGHADDFGAGFGGFVVGLFVAAVGVVLLLVAGGVYLFDRVRGG